MNSNRHPAIQYGDTVIAYVNPESMKPVEVAAGQTFQNRFGTFHHDDMIGLRFVHLLEPTPELWTLVLPHRTQILYQPDISLISSFLELQPGVNVIEAGTGSGSFSHSIARSIAPNGKLFTFEFHEERAAKAKLEFAQHGLSDIIVSQHRDVCKNGFGIFNSVTAIFLDLPSPWEALENAKAAFDPQRVGRICCFSPCIEQVQRTCETLKALGFYDIRMFECLVRPYEVQRIESEKLPLAGPTPKGSHKAFKRQSAGADAVASSPSSVLTSKPKESVRGHTSFLTFAVLLPTPPSDGAAPHPTAASADAAQ
ncbi:tRNA (adenine-N(1)-)-methyltransferase catalytic subunit trm61 [Polyrhizophydium stewartii]|uniref:tRNA (adenine(58)-N(1))-methyltransferase catalytic subunit TRM61 n=1 Tax=Polyrhizophydium stewartii TaxID=2732419 RepID=A0ABR4NEK4_9FUNG